MTLYIDSTDSTKTIIKINDKIHEFLVSSPKEQNVFGFIVSSIEADGFTSEDIKKIEVNVGPGSFTGTRVGVAIANSLAFALNITVNGKEPPIEPIYSSEPHITISTH